MIAVDTSALMAVLLREPPGRSCIAALAAEPEVMVSAGTVAEALIVAGRRNVGSEMAQLIDSLGLEIVPVTLATARHIAEAHARWGKGTHPAGLNFGDCFAYALAKAQPCPLLYIGRDFARTDIESAL